MNVLLHENLERFFLERDRPPRAREVWYAAAAFQPEGSELNPHLAMWDVIKRQSTAQGAGRVGDVANEHIPQAPGDAKHVPEGEPLLLPNACIVDHL